MRRDSRARILVVEDEPELAAEVDQTLVELGYDVVGRAARSDEAIERTEQRRPDLLLMDIRLRGKRDGIETAAEIRDRFRLPVVFMSAHTDEATLGRARRSSPYGYVVKPFTLGELWTAIEIALERHALETKLREGERWFQTTLRSIGDAILCTGVDGTVTFMNQRAERMLGWRFDDVAERPAAEVFRLVEERSRTPVTLPLEAVLRGETSAAIPAISDGLLLIDRAGGGIPIDASLAPITDDNKVLGAVVVFRDLSDRRVLQQRLEFADRLAALGTMAAGIAHEVNNPLAVIMANLAMLSEHQARGRASGRVGEASWLDTGTVREILADAVTAADRVRRIVADLRSFTQADEAGEGPVDVERSLKWALQSTAREFRHRARVVTNFGQLPLLAGSEVRLGQVFVNLLVNAAHSISPGQVNNNEVRVGARTDERGWVVVEVSDTGSGIPPEIRGKIFDPFFTTKPTGMGSGLGLSVCLGIVKSFGGEIQVESEIGRGSVFRVRLPPGTPVELPAEPPELEGDRQLRPRVLVIDDEPLVRRAIERSLEGEHDVVSAASAAEALAILERGEPFDLVLCDLMMPDMTGMDVAARLARDRPDVAAKLVFLSGGAFTPEAAAFLAAAGRRHVEKPFRPHDLQQRVRALLAEQHAKGLAAARVAPASPTTH